MTLTLDWLSLRAMSPDDDDEIVVDFVESGDIAGGTSISCLGSCVWQQMQAIFSAARENRLTNDQLEMLLCEVQAALVDEMRLFKGFPDIEEFDLYSIGKQHIMTGLEMLSEACLIARFSEQRTGLSKAESIGRQGEDELRSGRQLLNRAAAVVE
ncbi:MAG TPA: hypothetical protein VGO93_00395 [Candidatus Xenobia bacterium]|jgi:hypothetical protein